MFIYANSVVQNVPTSRNVPTGTYISILFPPPKPNLQKLKLKLQNLMGPNDMDIRNNGVKSKSVVIPIVKSSGILDTFSLSFVGNLNFSNAIQGLQKIVEGLASCEFRAGLLVNVSQLKSTRVNLCKLESSHDLSHIF